MLFTPARKVELAVALKDRLEQRRLRLPHSQVLVDDLRSVKSEVGAAGVPRLVAARDAGGHADRFWALALACAAAADAPADFSAWRTAGAAATARLGGAELGAGGWGTVRRTWHGY